MADRQNLPNIQLSFNDATSDDNVNDTVKGLNAFGLNLKNVLDDIYTKIKAFQAGGGADPAKLQIRLDMEYAMPSRKSVIGPFRKFNQAVRSFNGSIEDLDSPLKVPQRCFVNANTGEFNVIDVALVPGNIRELNELTVSLPDMITINGLLADLGVGSAVPAGTTPGNEINTTQPTLSARKRQLRIALGLAPFPISIA